MKTTLVLLFILFLEIVSSAMITSPQNRKTSVSVPVPAEIGHESMIQAHGMPKSLSNLTPFGDSPVIERLGNRNVKTTRRRLTTPKDDFGSEPSIQAYGLPKRRMESNGYIEKVSVDRVSGLDGKVDKVHIRGEQPGIYAFGISRRNPESNGVIERVGHVPNKQETDSSSGKGDESFIRRVRSLDKGVENDLMDLEPQEAKVFRPLFVYKRQVADRYKLNSKKNPIYGAYQYGGKRQRNSIYRYRKYD